jgi:hypothetical protein
MGHRASFIEAMLMPHPTFLEIAALVGYRAWWRAPDWGLKVVELADAIRRFRR